MHRASGCHASFPVVLGAGFNTEFIHPESWGVSQALESAILFNSSFKLVMSVLYATANLCQKRLYRY